MSEVLHNQSRGGTIVEGVGCVGVTEKVRGESGSLGLSIHRKFHPCFDCSPLAHPPNLDGGKGLAVASREDRFLLGTLPTQSENQRQNVGIYENCSELPTLAQHLKESTLPIEGEVFPLCVAEFGVPQPRLIEKG